VNNAGVSWQGTLDTYDPEQVARMRPSQRGRRDPCHARGDRSMRAQRYEPIVNVASIAGIGTAPLWECILCGNEGGGADSHAALCLELGQHGISVNAVAPGFVRTDMTQRGRGAADWPGRWSGSAARAMMGRIGEPEDIAMRWRSWLHPESGWITAQVLTVDGGGWTILVTVRSNAAQVAFYPCRYIFCR